MYCDYYGDGFAEATGWVSPDAGFLFMDRNANGVIDNGSELFGSLTPLPGDQPAANGFQALAALDSNQDGMIDAQDPAYSQLRVWASSSGDENWQQGELFTLPQLGITSIDLNWTTLNTTDAQGNIEMSAGSFQKTDGSTGLIAEYGFQIEPYNTLPLETLPVPDDIAALPDLPASGLVYNLRQAMVRDTSGRLEALVKQFAAENDPNVRTSLMDQILFQWTGSENLDPSGRGGSIDARKLAVVEAFMGYQWSSTVAYQGNYSNPNPGVSVMLDSLYHDISAVAYGVLMAQTHFKDLFGMINYTIDPNTKAKIVDPDSVAEMFNQLKSEVASDPVHGQELVSEFYRTVAGAGGLVIEKGAQAAASEESVNITSALANSALAETAGVESSAPVGGSSGSGSSGGGASCNCTCICLPPPPGNLPPQPRRDPLVFDVTGFGIETTSINGFDTQYPTYFDYNGNGFAILTGWASGANGLLVMDRNGNGTIDDGSELFSGYTLLSNGRTAHNGYEALGDLDTNHDGQIDSSDAAFSGLEIWQDVNGDGWSQEWELHSLSFYDITSINAPTSFPAAPNTANPDAQGNFLQVTGTYTKADGTFGQVAEYNFATNPTYSISEQWTGVSGAIAALPDLPGFGTLRSLQQTMAQDTSGNLQSMVEQFADSTDRSQWADMAEKVLFQWTGAYDTAGVPQNLRQLIPGYMDACSYQVAVQRGLVGSDSARYGAMTADEWNEVMTYRQSLMNAVLDQFYPAAKDQAFAAKTVGAGFVASSPWEWDQSLSAGNAQGASFNGAHEQWGANYAAATVDKSNILSPQECFRQILELMKADLMVQTHLSDLYNLISYNWDDAQQQYVPDMSPVVNAIKTALNENPEQGKQMLADFAETVRALNGQDRLACLTCREEFVELDPSLGWVIDTGGLPVHEAPPGTDHFSHFNTSNDSEAIQGSLIYGDGAINGWNGNDVIYGTSRNERLTNDTGDALLVGGGGNDTIWAGPGDDILDGGEGNDTLMGETGNDTYIFRRGSGQDTIIDADSTAGNIDTIWLGSNLTPEDITLRRSENNIVLRINDTTDTLTIKDFFRNNSPLNRVEQIQFMDGTVWTEDDIVTKVYAPTEGDDVIYGSSENDDLSGAGGNDKLYAEAGADSLHGDSGNDKLYGGSGSDVLDGGTGDDVLDGGLGNDTYLFSRGSGQDTIVDQDTSVGNLDTIQLGEGIAPTDIKLERIGNGFKLTIPDTGDSVAVTSWLQGDTPRYGVEAIRFADGTTWDVDTIKQQLLQGTAGDDTIVGYSSSDTIQGLEGADTLYGRAGDDTLDGGAGNDTVYGEAGNDTLRGGEGDDTLLGGAGDDILDGGPGDDILTGGASTDSQVYLNHDNANGDDTYLFGRGSGQDIIVDHDKTVGNVDTILLGDGITSDDIKFERKGDDLELTITGADDKLTVKNYFWNDSTEYRVERIQFADGTVWSIDDLKSDLNQGTSGDDILIGYSVSDALNGYEGSDKIYGRGGDDILDGGPGDDNVYGESGADTLLGGEGTDKLAGGAGDDIIDGGAGNDTLYGGDELDTSRSVGSNGNDTYLFGRGSGQDTITDYDKTAGNLDAILLNNDVLPTDVAIRRDGDNLVLTINDAPDTLTVNNWFKDEVDTWQVEQIQFADGTTWNVDAIKQMVLEGTPGDDLLIGYSASSDTIRGYDGNDTIYGRSGDDILEGGAGNDALYAEAGDDTLRGGDGTDTLSGGAGNDILDGGAGIDTMDGGTGNDTYVFARGSGQDTIVDYDATPGNTDTITLASDVAPTNVTLSQSGDDLVIAINGTTDSLQVFNWFLNDSNKVERLQFADGTVWDAAHMEEIATRPPNIDNYIYGTPGNDGLAGTPLNDAIYGYAGNDTIWGQQGSDLLYGGSGNDTIHDGTNSIYDADGDDTLYGETGNDYLYGGKGADTFVFSLGDGVDVLSDYSVRHCDGRSSVYQCDIERSDGAGATGK